jgi:hypothetical protein
MHDGFFPARKQTSVSGAIVGRHAGLFIRYGCPRLSVPFPFQLRHPRFFLYLAYTHPCRAHSVSFSGDVAAPRCIGRERYIDE